MFLSCHHMRNQRHLHAPCSSESVHRSAFILLCFFLFTRILTATCIFPPRHTPASHFFPSSSLFLPFSSSCCCIRASFVHSELNIIDTRAHGTVPDPTYSLASTICGVHAVHHSPWCTTYMFPAESVACYHTFSPPHIWGWRFCISPLNKTHSVRARDEGVRSFFCFSSASTTFFSSVLFAVLLGNRCIDGLHGHG